jgi:hypothetical protein
MTPREIDALVAEKVMGWTPRHDPRRCDGTRIIRCFVCGRLGHGNCYGYGRGGEPIQLYCGGESDVACCEDARRPRYSASIADAWPVVEKLKEDGDVFIEWWSDGEWLVSKYPVLVRQADGGRDSVVAPTAPMAICLYALHVAGVAVAEVPA